MELRNVSLTLFGEEEAPAAEAAPADPGAEFDRLIEGDYREQFAEKTKALRESADRYEAVAPVLVFVIVASALAQGQSRLDRRFGMVIWLYMLTTFLAAGISVISSRLFPQTIVLAQAAEAEVIQLKAKLYDLLVAGK